MFKVICVNNKPFPNSWVYDWNTVEGESYTVIFEKNSFTKDLVFEVGYVLNEDPYNYERAFDKSRFIPLSNIDEKELSTNKNLDYANI